MWSSIAENFKKLWKLNNREAHNQPKDEHDVNKGTQSNVLSASSLKSGKMLLNLTQSLQLRPNKDHVLFELATSISSAVNADGFTLYIAEPGGPPDDLTIYTGQSMKYEKVKHPDNSIPIYVAKTKESIRFSRSIKDSRFPNGIPKNDKIDHILCQAISQPDGQLIAVLELYRREECLPFQEEDEEICFSYLVWGGIALHYAHLFVNMGKQRKLNEFLLAVVKSIFQDMISIDILVAKIMKFAQRLVDADRASLFLVDCKSQELYATIFDVGIDESTETAVNSDDELTKTKDEIRFPIGTGIAGIVAQTGEVLNIHDVYSDPRFNRSIDQKTGYKSETILCMPIFIRKSIIGVVQMVNKRCGHFSKDDEAAFEMFAVYCGLALHHAKLYNKIRRSEQKYKVALEVLSYHNTSTEDEVQQFLDEQQTSPIAPNLDQYYFDPFAYGDLEKVKFANHMFVDLFGLRRFDPTILLRFTLTIKKNYRRVQYHNWSHGFSVANTIYTLIKQSGGNVFRPIECLALYIGSLCHDLDHRGKNNKFMLEMESPLAAIYSTSTMEHHHFNQTVIILQQEGHNIFAKLSHLEYKEVLGLIKHCILATDLELFFSYKTKLTALVDEEKFTWSSHEHRLLIQAIAMTAADLSASAKPWDIQEKTVKVIFQEFYDQGDAERAAGLTPLPMMDRNRPTEQASSQVGFLNGICIPCYSLLYRLIPEAKPLLQVCQENLDQWQQKMEMVSEKKS